MTIPQGGVYDSVIFQGATFHRTFTLKDAQGDLVDLSGYTAEAELRDKEGGESILAQFDCDVDGPAGTVTISLTPTQTAALDLNTMHYDVFLIGSGDTLVLVQGKLKLDRRVTVVGP